MRLPRRSPSPRLRPGLTVLIVVTAWLSTVPTLPEETPTGPSRSEIRTLRERAETTLRRATEFFRKRVAIEGGYLWRYSADLERREGEGKVATKTAWVQPPGTPSVGEAYLEAYRRTGEESCLDAARETAGALVRGQLRSGGWDYRIEFELRRRRRYSYRVQPPVEGARNTSTLDDNTTQAATRFLMRLDRALDFDDAPVHEAAAYALDRLLAVQYPNGAWPQRFEDPSPASDFPVKRASLPERWMRLWPKNDYRALYTFNDNALVDTIELMLEAATIYEDQRYREAALRAGEFILLAQLPDPQPGWAQQYDVDMQPAWARRFEPPAITGGEAREILRTLLRLHAETGETRYLEPVPRALEYYRRCELEDGRLARFYEIGTNRPLYFNRKYEVTYGDRDLPTHYAFKLESWVDRIEREYESVLRDRRSALPRRDPVTLPHVTTSLLEQVRRAVGSLDERGAWVEPGSLRYHGAEDPTERIIDCRTFISRVRALATFLAATSE